MINIFARNKYVRKDSFGMGNEMFYKMPTLNLQ